MTSTTSAQYWACPRRCRSDCGAYPDLDQGEASAQKRRRRKKAPKLGQDREVCVDDEDALPNPITDLGEASCSAPEPAKEESALANPEQDEAFTNPDLEEAEASAQKRRRRKNMPANLGIALSGGLFVDDDDLGEASAQKRRRRHSRGASLGHQDRLAEPAGDDDLGEAPGQV